eukprot:Lankesteria_metandrocarpae@DN4268_c0_g1_i14.p1
MAFLLHCLLLLLLSIPDTSLCHQSHHHNCKHKCRWKKYPSPRHHTNHQLQQPHHQQLPHHHHHQQLPHQQLPHHQQRQDQFRPCREPMPCVTVSGNSSVLTCTPLIKLHHSASPCTTGCSTLSTVLHSGYTLTTAINSSAPTAGYLLEKLWRFAEFAFHDLQSLPYFSVLARAESIAGSTGNINDVDSSSTHIVEHSVYLTAGAATAVNNNTASTYPNSMPPSISSCTSNDDCSPSSSDSTTTLLISSTTTTTAVTPQSNGMNGTHLRGTGIGSNITSAVALTPVPVPVFETAGLAIPPIMRVALEVGGGNNESSGGLMIGSSSSSNAVVIAPSAFLGGASADGLGGSAGEGTGGAVAAHPHKRSSGLANAYSFPTAAKIYFLNPDKVPGSSSLPYYGHSSSGGGPTADPVVGTRGDAIVAGQGLNGNSNPTDSISGSKYSNSTAPSSNSTNSASAGLASIFENSIVQDILRVSEASSGQGRSKSKPDYAQKNWHRPSGYGWVHWSDLRGDLSEAESWPQVDEEFADRKAQPAFGQ